MTIPEAEPMPTRPWRLRALVGVVLASLTLLVGATWALSYAPFGGPDDDFHLGSIWCAWGDAEGLCTTVGLVDEPQKVVDTPALAGLMEDCWVTVQEQSAACSALDPRTTTRANNGLYPSGFYRLMRVFVGDDGLRSLMVMRMAAFTLGAALIACGILLNRRQDWARLALVSLVALGPLGLFILASVNPSALAISGLYAGFLATVAMLRARTPGTLVAGWMLAAVGFTGAAISRTDGVYFAGLMAAAAGLAALPLSLDRVRAWLPATAALGVVLLVLLATQRSGGESVSFGSDGEPWKGSLWAFPRVVELPQMYFGAFAQSTGWLEVYVPELGHLPRTLALGAVLLFGLRRFQWPRALSLALLAVFMVLLPLVMLAPLDLHVGVFAQPRYVLPMLLAAAAVLTIRRATTPAGLTLSQGVTLAGLAAVANSLTLHATIRRFVSGNDVFSMNLNKGADWWWDIPVGPNTLWALGSVAFFALAVVFALLASRDQRSNADLSEPVGPAGAPAASPG